MDFKRRAQMFLHWDGNLVSDHTGRLDELLRRRHEMNDAEYRQKLEALLVAFGQYLAARGTIPIDEDRHLN